MDIQDKRKTEAERTGERKMHENKLDLLLPESLHHDLKKIATVRWTALNDLINNVLQDYVNENQEALKEYTKLWGDK